MLKLLCYLFIYDKIISNIFAFERIFFMNICVFGAASNDIDKNYLTEVEKTCAKLARRGHNLVYGGGANGVMGAAARGFSADGGSVTGVVPEFFKESLSEAINTSCTRLIYTETMQQRKKTMEDMADAFLIAPGGIGTFDEFFEVLTLKQLGRHEKPIAVYSINHYYSPLEAMLENAINGGFLTPECKSIYRFVYTFDSLAEYIENGDSATPDASSLKNG